MQVVSCLPWTKLEKSIS